MAIASKGERLVMYFEKNFEFKNGVGVQVEVFKYDFEHRCNINLGVAFYKSEYTGLICYETLLSLFKFGISINFYRET